MTIKAQLSHIAFSIYVKHCRQSAFCLFSPMYQHVSAMSSSKYPTLHLSDTALTVSFLKQFLEIAASCTSH